MPQPGSIVLADVLRSFGLSVVESNIRSGECSPSSIQTLNFRSLDAFGNDSDVPEVNVIVTRAPDPKCIILAEASSFDTIRIAGANLTGLWVEGFGLAAWAEKALACGADITVTPADAPSGVPGYLVAEKWGEEQLATLALATIAVMRCLRWSFTSVSTTLEGEHAMFPSGRPWQVERWRSVLRGRDTSPTFPATENPLYRVQPNDNWEKISGKLLGVAGRWKEIADLNGGEGRPLLVGHQITVPAEAIVDVVGELEEAPLPDAPTESADRSLLDELPVITPGEQHKHVRLLRSMLTALGYETGPLSLHYAIQDDALFDAICRFQGEMNVQQTGVFDRDCWASLLGEEPLPVLSKKSPLRIVHIGKALLLVAGQNPGVIDTGFDKLVTAAVSSLQSASDISVSGNTDYPTWRLLLGLS